MENNLLDLPEEVIFAILGYLTVQEVIRFSLICKFCNEITQDSEIWKDFVSKLDPNKCSYLEQTGITVKNWRGFYSKLLEQENWQMSHIASKILSGHKGPINCIDFNKDFILSGSSDSTIRVWNLRNGIPNATLKNTLKAHADSVKCLQFDNEKIISGSSDLSVKLWKLRDGSVNLLYNHGGGVLCLNYDNFHLVSGSRDQTVRLFDLSSKQLLQRYMADSYVHAIQLHDNTIASSGNGFVNFRDKRTGMTFENIKIAQKLPILSFKNKANNVVFSTEKGVIYLYDIRKAAKPVIEKLWFNYRTLLNEAHVDYLASFNKIVATYGPYLSVLSVEGNEFKKQFTIREFYGNSFSGVKANYNTIVAGGNDYNVMVLKFSNSKKTGYSEIPLVDVQ